MGAFLSTPVTETFPVDDLIDGKIAYGASSMQGYRTTQEDAHLCLLDFDKDTYLFGVFDGHGGAEVAQYAAKKYPEFLKNNESYKNKDYVKALIDSFLEFDASLIKDDVYKELKVLAGDNFSSAEEDEDMSGNLDALKEEAKLPLTELLERLSKGKSTGKKERQSKLKAQKSIEQECNSNSEQCSSSSSKDNDQSMEPCSSSKLIVENGESSNNSKSNSIESTVSSTGEDNNKAENEAGCSENSNQEQEQPSSSNSVEQSSSNNLKEEPTSTNQEQSSSSSTGEKSSPAKKRVKATQIAPKASFLEMLNQIDDEEDSDDDSMEEDEDDEEDSEMYDSEDESEENEEEEEVDDEEESESEDGETLDFFKNGAGAYSRLEEGPGKDSGCTAVIVLIKDQKLYVANAGDSRCVLSRLGKEIEMSYDHKPTSEIEYNRIKKAGGCVTQDGRVNGGLNLSRAFGDHAYKKNQELPLEEQMITALPDVKIIDLKPEEDDFIVIACDGIWNSMSSAEVVEYINKELKKEKKLSKICDSLFFNCLAEDTRGDGRGCDNQTCIIIKLRDLPSREELLNNKVDNKVKEDNKSEENNSEELKKNIKIVNELNDNGKRKLDEDENSLNGESTLNKKTKSESE